MSYQLNYTGEEIDERLQLFDLIYPVGSIYMSVNVTSPTTLFGGEWKQIEDTFLLAAGSNYAAGSTGGEATHTLSVDEMPTHTHKVGIGNNANFLTWHGDNIRGTEVGWAFGYEEVYSDNNNVLAGSVGKSYAHNNMPPYLVVYMWKRVG